MCFDVCLSATIGKIPSSWLDRRCCVMGPLHLSASTSGFNFPIVCGSWAYRQFPGLCGFTLASPLQHCFCPQSPDQLLLLAQSSSVNYYFSRAAFPALCSPCPPANSFHQNLIIFLLLPICSLYMISLLYCKDLFPCLFSYEVALLQGWGCASPRC